MKDLNKREMYNYVHKKGRYKMGIEEEKQI